MKVVRRKAGPAQRRDRGAREVPPIDLEIRRGDILWVSCDPSIGAEPKKTRTCVVVSNDIANRYGAAITFVPTQVYTSERASRAYMADLRRPRSSLDEARVANASMVMTYDRRRVVGRAGRASADAMRSVDAALALHLALDAPSATADDPDERSP